MWIKKIQVTLTDAVGKIFNTVNNSVDKTTNAPSINYMENYVDTVLGDIEAALREV